MKSKRPLVVSIFTDLYNSKKPISDSQHTGCRLLNWKLMVQMQNLGKITGFDFRETTVSAQKDSKNMKTDQIHETEKAFDFIVSLDVISDQGIRVVSY